MSNDGTKNLIPFSQMDPEEAHKIQLKGGAARGKQKAQEKEFRRILKALLNDKSEEMPELDKKTMVNLKLIEQALKGNVKAYEVLRDTIGEKPVDEVSNTITTDKTSVEELVSSIEGLKNEDNSKVS